MKKLSRRGFFGKRSLDGFVSMVSVSDRGLFDMHFSIFIRSDVTLHRSFMASDNNKNLEKDRASATKKIEDLIDTLDVYIDRLKAKESYEDHRAIGVMRDPVTDDYHGESSTVHLQMDKGECIFCITSCEHKLRLTLCHKETSKILTSINKQLRLHLADMNQLLDEYLS